MKCPSSFHFKWNLAGCKFSNKQIFLNKSACNFCRSLLNMRKKMKISHFDILPFCGYFHVHGSASTCLLRTYYMHQLLKNTLGSSYIHMVLWTTPDMKVGGTSKSAVFLKFSELKSGILSLFTWNPLPWQPKEKCLITLCFSRFWVIRSSYTKF